MLSFRAQALRSARLVRPSAPSFSSAPSFRAEIDPSLLVIHKSDKPGSQQPKESLKFGKSFSPHMLEVDWTKDGGWGVPVISPYHNFEISPAATALHYGIECFEGMKAYRGKDGEVRMFRPDKNMARLQGSMARLAMPEFNPEGFLACLKQLLQVDKDWIPEGEGYSMYIRPTAIGTSPYLGVEAAAHVKLYAILSPVGPYYPSGFKPIRLYADTENCRAWPGGVGFAKVGGNYGPTILPSMQAASKHGTQQVLWLYGEDHQVTEVGAMNIFFLMRQKDSTQLELVTAPLDRGDILAGVTRDSILGIARNWQKGNLGTNSTDLGELGNMKVSERWLTMAEVVEASGEGRLLEAFGAGTAVVVAPVSSIVYKGQDITLPTGDSAGPLAQRVWDTLRDIHYGDVEHEWSVKI